jgi:DNA/RNA endonuclease G (NUC1)
MNAIKRQHITVAVAAFGILFGFSGCTTAPKTAQPESSATESMQPMAAMAHTESSDENIIYGEPVTNAPVQKLVNVGYTVGYSHTTRTPLWVSYHLFKVGAVDGLVRNDAFAADPRVANPVDDDDYANSGYDRGHMAPSSPIGKRYGQEAQDNTFKMTNMVPQLPGLNQRGWEALERIISTDWAENFKKVWVIVGPVFRGDCKELLAHSKRQPST